MTSKEWFSAIELEGVEGLPNAATSISRKARIEGWKKRQIPGVKGISYEFHVSGFPLATKAALGYSEISEDKVSEAAATYIHIKNDIIKIPQYNVKASAGGGLVVTDENIIGQISVGKDWIYKQGLANLNLALIEVSGDSMEPTLSSGDLAMISLIKPSCTDTVEGIHRMNIIGKLQKVLKGVK